jgi:hypothetical protein
MSQPTKSEFKFHSRDNPESEVKHYVQTVHLWCQICNKTVIIWSRSRQIQCTSASVCVCVCALCKQQLQSFQQCALYYLYSLNFLFHRGWKLLRRSVLLIFPTEGTRYSIPFFTPKTMLSESSTQNLSAAPGVPQKRHDLVSAPQGRPVSFVCSIKEHYFMNLNPEEHHKHLLIQSLADIQMVTTCPATPWPCSKHIARRCRVKSWMLRNLAKRRKRQTGNTEEKGGDFVHLLTWNENYAEQ